MSIRNKKKEANLLRLWNCLKVLCNITSFWNFQPFFSVNSEGKKKLNNHSESQVKVRQIYFSKYVDGYRLQLLQIRS